MAVPRWLEGLGWGALAAFGVGLWAFPEVVADLRQAGAEQVVAWDCDVHAGPCDVALAGGRGPVRVSFTPLDFTHGDPVQVRVSAPERAGQTVTLDVLSTSMNMGLTSVQLVPEDGAWVGEVVLPICTQSTMTWRADLSLAAASGPTESVRFDFVTEARP